MHEVDGNSPTRAPRWCIAEGEIAAQLNKCHVDAILAQGPKGRIRSDSLADPPHVQPHPFRLQAHPSWRDLQ